ncbi:glutarate dioxygenase GlaH [Bacillus safensis]|uniref:glutarate dioxygenase GlaH n=1 Tax=Bacillus safensis TaxID=561879 RepID=UPI002FFD99A6
MKTIKKKQMFKYIQNDRYFKIEVHPQHDRLYVVTVSQKVLNEFFETVQKITLQRLKYVEFERFYLANELNRLIGDDFASIITEILKDRESGGFTLNSNCDLSNHDNYIKLATALSYCVGKPCFDAMSGNYYAEFAVKHTDNSDTYLRSAYTSLHLHSDGAYEKEIIDWLLMMKLGEEYAVGGNSKLLHIDDWSEQKLFSDSPIGQEKVERLGAKSKNVEEPQYRPTFFEHNGAKCICFAEQNIKPANMEQAIYFRDLFNSIEQSDNLVSLHLPIGELVMINNLFWLHGREPFKENEKLYRVLLRQRGKFLS